MSSSMTSEETSDRASDNKNPFKKSVAPLSNGVLKIYEPSLVTIKNNLKELSDKEVHLLSQIHEENLILSEVQHSPKLHEMFRKIELYQNKLINIKKQMKTIHDKSSKLKKRVAKIQQAKEKQDQIKLQKELEIKMEEDLIAKH